ncbi:MAG TPA: hydroxymethylbilane synthase [Candidatus Dormibacteraeota bacterium]|nr:hydroxymethylbilane synthase [Candidatus Dormibacteraeota bacterium]
MRLATRGSALARRQAALAAAALTAAGVTHIDEVIVQTTSDRNPEVPLDRLDGQGWFVAELERALLDGRADVAVHSAKDLPSELAPGLCIAALLERADPRDVAVTAAGTPIAELPSGARVGTGSARRVAFLRALHPSLEPVGIRGNVDTRLRRLDAGEVDALVLAAAGLERLGAADRAVERLDPSVFVPSPAQGAIALETRYDAEARALCAGVDVAETRLAVTAERTVLSRLGGGCLIPLGAWARVEDGRLVLTAALATDGEIRRATLAGDPMAPEELGARVAEELR